MCVEHLLNGHKEFCEKRLFGRYITATSIAKIIADLPPQFEVKTIGFSVENRPIHSIKIGTGKLKIFLWSQMHGNESTTTKAVFDFFKAAQKSDAISEVSTILEECTLCFVPILNPDGAFLYTRENANGIDLNRDAQRRSEPESALLWKLYSEFAPDYCFNLHGQRTIYGFEDTGKPSILSFLAPAADSERSITLSRKRSMKTIAYINKHLQEYLPDQIGRYDDTFTIDCTGDTFQAAGTPTLLFEAGHYPDDYKREITRRYIYSALIIALYGISTGVETTVDAYFKIPEHQKCFCDILIKNTKRGDVAIQYTEKLTTDTITFLPQIVSIDTSSVRYGHQTINANGSALKDHLGNVLDDIVDVKHIYLDDGSTITL